MQPHLGATLALAVEPADCGARPSRFAPSLKHVIEADIAPPTTTHYATAEPAGQPTSTLKEQRNQCASVPPADDRRNGPRCASAFT